MKEFTRVLKISMIFQKVVNLLYFLSALDEKKFLF